MLRTLYGLPGRISIVIRIPRLAGPFAGVCLVIAMGVILPAHAAVPDDVEVSSPAWRKLMQPLYVVSVDPANGTSHETLPVEITVVLNRAVKVTTVSSSTVELKTSGGDGSFTEGNEVALTPTGISASGNIITIDLVGTAVADEEIQLSLIGTGSPRIKGSFGLMALDGNADGRPGADFINIFSVTAPPTGAIPTLADVQASVFTPNCAVSGCHSSVLPQEGMSLSAGETWSNTVSVQSNQLPSLNRIEPGNPDDSYLVRKIEGGTELLTERMPRLRPALPQSQIDMVRAWISAGAEDSGGGPGPIPEPTPSPY